MNGFGIIAIPLGVVCLVLMLIAGAGGPDVRKQEVKKELGHVSCIMIPENKKDLVADKVVQCVNNATAKSTGENQDADDWVEACGEEISKIYRVSGYRLASSNNSYDDDYHYLSECKEFTDSTVTQ
jgi:hypothetical protein